MRFKVFIIVLLFPAISFAQKKIITHEDMWMMKRVGAPQISSNGKWIVFSVADPAYDEKDQSTDLWIASSDGNSKPRKVTSSKGGEGNYTWSLDGKQIAFTAKREGDEMAQVYVINIADGGEAQRITNLSTGAGAPVWSRDGKMILFTSNVFRGAFTDSANKKVAEEKKKIKYKVREYTSYPIRFWDHWLDEKEAHLFVQKAEPGAIAKDIFSTINITDSSEFMLRGDAVWAPNNTDIIFTATTEYKKGALKDPPNNVYVININELKLKILLADGADHNNVTISDDGKFLYSLAGAINNNKVYNLDKLVRYDWPAMSGKTILAPKLDRPISKYIATDKKIVLNVETEGNDKIYTILENETEASLLTTSTAGCYTNISVSGDGTIVSNYESSSMPAEVVKINGGVHANITDFNAAKLAALDLPLIETFWFTSSKGKKIKNILVRPGGFDAAKKYPLFVVMHGGPASSFKDNWGYRWNYQLLAAPGYVLLMTDYTGSTGYGEKFTQDIQFDPFKGPADEINEAGDYAIKKYSFIDGNRQAAGGGSYGGHLANWMQASTTRYKCLICHAGTINSESQWGSSDNSIGREVMNGSAPWLPGKGWKQNPLHYAAKFKTPMLITVGEQDFRVPLNNSLENFTLHQRLQIPSKLLVFPEENHWILKGENSRYFYAEVQKWLNTYLK
jgi:dipeptidyl aminopeptidase/acylaminoacyl peptidase